MSDKITYFLKINKIPNLLIYGNNGVGKKTIVKNFINELYKTEEDKNKYVLKYIVKIQDLLLFLKTKIN